MISIKVTILSSMALFSRLVTLRTCITCTDGRSERLKDTWTVLMLRFLNKAGTNYHIRSQTSE